MFKKIFGKNPVSGLAPAPRASAGAAAARVAPRDTYEISKAGAAQGAAVPRLAEAEATLPVVAVERSDMVQECADRLPAESFEMDGEGSHLRLMFDLEKFPPQMLDSMGVDGSRPLVVHIDCYEPQVQGPASWRTSVTMGVSRAKRMDPSDAAARLVYQVERIIKSHTENAAAAADPRVLRRVWVDLHNRVAQRLTHLGDYCVVCDKAQEVQGLKPVPCADAVCNFAYDNLGIGSCIEMIQRQPEVSDFLLATSAAAVNMVASRRDQVFDEVPASFRMGVARHGKMAAIDWGLLSQAFAALPSVQDMAAAPSLRESLLGHANQGGHTVALPTYDLLRWVLSSVRGHLMPLQPSERFTQMNTPNQFLLSSSTPEREAQFAEAKAKHGSYFAFHGSGFANWHGIMRQSLKNASGTALQSAGAAYGSGIYMALDSGISASYSQNVGSASMPWGASALGRTPVCLALCEVITGSERSDGGGYRVVPDDTKVIARYLFVYGAGQKTPAVNVSCIEPLCRQRVDALAASFKAFQPIRDAAAAAEAQSLAALQRFENTARVPALAHAVQQDAIDVGSSSPTPAVGSGVVKDEDEDNDWAGYDSDDVASDDDGDGVEAPVPATKPALELSLPLVGDPQKRLAVEYKRLAAKGLIEKPTTQAGYQAYPAQDFRGNDSLLHWEAKVWMNADTVLGKGLQELKRNGGQDHVTLRLDFSKDYPFAPPAVWVKGPRFEARHGFVSRGAVCMEMLAVTGTSTGWDPRYGIDNILSSILHRWHAPDADGKLADTRGDTFYTKDESLDGWKLAQQNHPEWNERKT